MVREIALLTFTLLMASAACSTDTELVSDRPESEVSSELEASGGSGPATTADPLDSEVCTSGSGTCLYDLVHTACTVYGFPGKCRTDPTNPGECWCVSTPGDRGEN